MIFQVATAVALSVCGADAKQLKRGGDGVVHCANRAFRIPLDLTDTERKQITGIRLFVSEDQGKTWTRHSDSAADTKSITYKANADGSHWFCIAVLEEDGAQNPPDMKAVEPGLKVAVDTKQPSLLIKPVRSTAGKRGVRWEIADDNIDFDTLRVACCEEGSTQWKALPVRHPDRAVVWFEDNQSIEKVQAVVRDRAGNQVIQQVDIVGDRFTKQTPLAFALSENKTDASALEALKAFAEARSAPPVNTAPAKLPAMPEKREVAQTKPAKLENSWKPPAMPISGSMDKQASTTRPQSTAKTATPSMPPATPPDVQAARFADRGSASSSTTLQHTAFSPKQPAKKREHTLCGVDPIVINYEVETAPGAAPSIMELWGTRDRGQTWTRLAVDRDGASPIEAEIKQDGVWGLRIFARSVKEESPKPGSEPDTYIEVDRTAPVVQLQPPEVNNGQVVLHYAAGDKNLPAEPITVSYSVAGKSGWRTIATNAENTGEYLWNYVRAGVTGQVNLRIEAKDEAGNIGAVEIPCELTSGPTATAKGRVLQVQPKTR